MNDLKGKDLLSIADLIPDQVELIFRTARELKAGAPSRLPPGKTLAMIFEKPSLRTRVTFEAGMTQLGGHAIFLAPSDVQMGVREPVADVGRNLDRWVDAIMARVFRHQTLVELAEAAAVPVINGLSDLEHPCQALADLFTILERKGRLRGLKLAYLGDGFNTCHSLLLLAARTGLNIAVATPPGYQPNPKLVEQARLAARDSQVEVGNDPEAAVREADAVYTDVWASMGLEEERQQRMKVFPPYQVNPRLMGLAKPDAIFLHCLPAHRGEEVTAEVLDGPQSVVLDEAENRLHVQKAVLELVIG